MYKPRVKKRKTKSFSVYFHSVLNIIKQSNTQNLRKKTKCEPYLNCDQDKTTTWLIDVCLMFLYAPISIILGIFIIFAQTASIRVHVHPYIFNYGILKKDILIHAFRTLARRYAFSSKCCRHTVFFNNRTLKSIIDVFSFQIFNRCKILF